MELSVFFKSVIDTDRSAVVLCDLNHTIVYMNPAAAERYAKRGGVALVGKNLMDCHNNLSCGQIQKAVNWFSERPENNLVYTDYNERENKDVYMVALRDGDGQLIGYYEKHEYRNPESMKRYDFHS